MNCPANAREQQLTVEFLEDLLLQAKSADERNLLAGILLRMQRGLMQPKRTETVTDIQRLDTRFEILKIYPEGAVSVGTILGIEYARRVLTCLRSTKDGAYILYERDTDRIVEPHSYSAEGTGE